MIKYCLPVVRERCEDVIHELARHHEGYDFLEVWLDTLVDYSDDFLEQLLRDYGQRLMVLFRRPQLAPIQMPLKQRLGLMNKVEDAGAILDLDVLTQQEEVAALKDVSSLRWIASYHNYQETPELTKLWDIVDELQSHNPWVVKLATFCQSPEDAVRLLKLGLALKQRGQECIVLGMGPHGAVTRTYGTLWYNAMIFAPPSVEGSTAPGQLTRPELEALFSTLS
ncbi:MAG: type I 3-dehydroquinate dehydratase [Deltaproteobacteria bacterium]|nr:MAG: type I 3-dehydroquinate dehydratase [Deltaproteobacteria bacterium]